MLRGNMCQMRRKIKKGDRLRIKPAWRDEGDDEIIWVAIEDEDGGRVRIQPQLDMPIRPNQVVTTDMVQLDDGAAPAM